MAVLLSYWIVTINRKKPAQGGERRKKDKSTGWKVSTDRDL